MTSPSRLGGFKILKDVARITLLKPSEDHDFPCRLCRILADENINLEFLTFARDGETWGVNTVVQTVHADKAVGFVKRHLGGSIRPVEEAAILSIFPHKSDPEVTASLFQVFGGQNLIPDALANSTSAVSVVLNKKNLENVTTALFDPFSFSAYRTPSDWKLAQKGKEQLYKEVVASYQEKKPKVYALTWQGSQEMVRLKVDEDTFGLVERLFKSLSNMELHLSFLMTTPSENENETTLFLCLPQSKKSQYQDMLEALPSGIIVSKESPVAHFSMNGPHFGDRYGIASELLASLQSAKIDILAMSCSIASISAVVHESQIQEGVKAIEGCFDVPSVFELSDE